MLILHADAVDVGPIPVSYTHLTLPTGLMAPEPVPGPVRMDVIEPVCSRISKASADKGAPHAAQNRSSAADTWPQAGQVVTD